MREAQPDACVHLAAVASVPAARGDPRLAWDVNLHGTLNLANALVAIAPGCVLLFAATADVYGTSFRSGVPLNEHAPLAPTNIYSATKAAADLALGAMAQDGLPVIRLRLFNHTGRGQSDVFALPAFARQIALIEAGEQEPVMQVGNLDARRDFLDVHDVCTAYVACLQHAQLLPLATLLNIASGVPRRIGDVLDALLKRAGVQVEIRIDSARLRPSDTPLAIGDAALARSLLGWCPGFRGTKPSPNCWPMRDRRCELLPTLIRTVTTGSNSPAAQGKFANPAPCSGRNQWRW